MRQRLGRVVTLIRETKSVRVEYRDPAARPGPPAHNRYPRQQVGKDVGAERQRPQRQPVRLLFAEPVQTVEVANYVRRRAAARDE